MICIDNFSVDMSSGKKINYQEIYIVSFYKLLYD